MYRIFVVEDDRTIAREVCRLAESWGMEAKSAEDLRNVAAEAAEMAAEPMPASLEKTPRETP